MEGMEGRVFITGFLRFTRALAGCRYTSMIISTFELRVNNFFIVPDAW